MNILIILGYSLIGLIFAVVTEEKADCKGYVNTKVWFWFGFFGSIIAYITICLQDEEKPNKRFSFIVILICICIFIMSFYYSRWPHRVIKTYISLGPYNEEKIMLLNDVEFSMPHDENWYVFDKYYPYHFENGFMYTEYNSSLVTHFNRNTETWDPAELTYFDYNDYIIGFDSDISFTPKNSNNNHEIEKDNLSRLMLSLSRRNNTYSIYIIKPNSPNDNQTYQVAEVKLNEYDMDEIYDKINKDPSYGGKIIDYIIENRLGEWYPE